MGSKKKQTKSVLFVLTALQSFLSVRNAGGTLKTLSTVINMTFFSLKIHNITSVLVARTSFLVVSVNTVEPTVSDHPNAKI